ncbi:MAG: RND family efflux transporter MFP subunit [Phenylobacterium sp.]|jgi:RND family efflux transporter MFP subunit
MKKTRFLCQSYLICLMLCLSQLFCLPAYAAEPDTSEPNTSKQATLEQASSTLTMVTTQPLDSLAFYPVKSAPAKVISLNHGKIPARVPGVLKHFNYRAGDEVKQGAVIARLDCQDIILSHQQMQTDVQQSNTTLAFNRRELKRANKLIKQQSISEAEVDRKKNAVKISQSQLKAMQLKMQQQQLNVQRCDIKAPFDGILTSRLVSVGEQIQQGQAVVELLQSNTQEVAAQVALSDQTAFIEADRYWFEVNGEKLPLTIRQIIPVVKDQSRSLESRLEFVDKTTYSGATGRVKWATKTAHLPAYLLQKRQKILGFFVLDNKPENAQAKFIKVGAALEGRPVPLPRSLDLKSEQYQLIIDGRFGLEDLQKVKLKED